MDVYVIPVDGDVAMAREGVEDLAFDATTGMAQIAHIEIASDEFNDLYREVLQDYEVASKFLLYFLHMGITTVKLQLETGMLRLLVPTTDGSIDPASVSRAIIDAAKPVAACLLHVGSVGDKLLISDEEIAQLDGGSTNLGVDFQIHHLNYIPKEDTTK
jgi:hypothetical protein